jgi:predicted RNase H-like nuclease
VEAVSCIGIDLAWAHDKPSGLAWGFLQGGSMALHGVTRPDNLADLLQQLDVLMVNSSCVVAVDAPLIVQNESGNRLSETSLNKIFRPYDAGAHPVNLAQLAKYTPQGQPAAPLVLAEWLAQRGFQHPMPGRNPSNRMMAEVYPHAAAITVLGEERIFKYKKGSADQKREELTRFYWALRALREHGRPFTFTGLRASMPELVAGQPLPEPHKAMEDELDAVFCCYLAGHIGQLPHKCLAFGDGLSGAIVVPMATEHPKIWPAVVGLQAEYPRFTLA